MINDPLAGWHRALQRYGDILAFEWDDKHNLPDSFVLRTKHSGVITVRLTSVRNRLPTFTSWRSKAHPSPFPPVGVRMPTILLNVKAHGYTSLVRALIIEAVSCDPELDSA